MVVKKTKKNFKMNRKSKLIKKRNIKNGKTMRGGSNKPTFMQRLFRSKPKSKKVLPSIATGSIAKGLPRIVALPQYPSSINSQKSINSGYKSGYKSGEEEEHETSFPPISLVKKKRSSVKIEPSIYGNAHAHMKYQNELNKRFVPIRGKSHYNIYGHSNTNNNQEEGKIYGELGGLAKSKSRFGHLPVESDSEDYDEIEQHVVNVARSLNPSKFNAVKEETHTLHNVGVDKQKQKVNKPLSTKPETTVLPVPAQYTELISSRA
jgi:hypothetical protein